MALLLIYYAFGVIWGYSDLSRTSGDDGWGLGELWFMLTFKAPIWPFIAIGGLLYGPLLLGALIGLIVFVLAWSRKT